MYTFSSCPPVPVVHSDRACDARAFAGGAGAKSAAEDDENASNSSGTPPMETKPVVQQQQQQITEPSGSPALREELGLQHAANLLRLAHAMAVSFFWKLILVSIFDFRLEKIAIS